MRGTHHNHHCRDLRKHTQLIIEEQVKLSLLD
jgi:hypothetical protein